MNNEVFWSDLCGAQKTAQFNARYWHHLANQYKFRDNAFRLVLALLAVAGTVAFKAAPENAQFWIMLTSSATAVSAAILPFLKWSKIIPSIESDRLKWIGIAQDYDDLAQELRTTNDWDSAFAEFKRIKKRDNSQSQAHDSLADDPAIKARATAEVIALNTPA